MSENDAISRISGIQMPRLSILIIILISQLKHIQFLKKQQRQNQALVDSSGIIEPKIAFDLADRVAKMHDIDIAEPLRELTKN